MDFPYLKKNYRLIAADLIKRKALDANSSAIQHIILTGKASAGAMIYYILKQSKETILQFSKGIKLTDTQLKKVKTAVKNKTGKNLRRTLKMFDGNNLPHELLLTTRQKGKLRNALNNNMSTDLQLSKVQGFSEGFLGSLLSKSAGPLMKVAVPFAKNILAPLGITAAASAIDVGIRKKIHGSGTTTLVILKKKKKAMVKIIKTLENSNILLEGVTKAVKNETREQKRRILRNISRHSRINLARKFIIRERNCNSWFW